MNFKDLLIPFALALLGTWAVQTLFFSKKTEQEGVRSGQAFTAPLRQEALPLNTEVDFDDAQFKSTGTLTEVETAGAYLSFNSAGAVLETLVFKRPEQADIVMVLPNAQTSCEHASFLVALPEKTPYQYKLVNHVETDTIYQLVYEAPFYAGRITKTFTVYKDRYQIDLDLALQLNSEQPVQARIFYPSPHMRDQDAPDTVSAIFNTESGSVSKTSRASLNVQQGWFSPTLFGTEGKYFIQSLVADSSNFVQRAYFKTCGQEGLTSILEGPTVDKSSSWNLSFYFGPKQRKAVEKVDERLEQTFDYSGILAPLSRLLLALLSYLYKYVHNYGLAIILLTILVKLILLPFTYKGEQTMRNMKKQQELSKKLRHLQQKYKNDPQVLARERTELIRKHGMPGMAGCLPLLIQMPIFFALNKALGGSFELYHASFLWIKDLALPDPYYILPALMSISIAGTALTGDPKQRMTMLAVALVIGAVVANLAAGLALFIAVSTGLGLLQTTLIKKLKKA